MQRRQSKAIAPKTFSQGFRSDRDWDKCARLISADAWSVAPMTGPNNRHGVCATLEAVLEAAIARVKAEEVYRGWVRPGSEKLRQDR
jgi:hypothetical protein